MTQYVQDNDERLMPRCNPASTISWRTWVQPYLQSFEVLRCPSNPNNNTAAAQPNAATQTTYMTKLQACEAYYK